MINNIIPEGKRQVILEMVSKVLLTSVMMFALLSGVVVGDNALQIFMIYYGAMTSVRAFGASNSAYQHKIQAK